ncbi:MAG: hypothetical protein A3D92_18125 [Bacteroidetes bacterium RIFCSPHIGHO2_02_FULL_44_7]|nr:MAG: hypothetical protein A3D92_18125 [Bacteroidetes bacterium RIFCSPHIGHO2_02_FULL_44_7]
MQSEKMIQSLVEHTRQFINRAEELKNYELSTLTWKENATSWSILECLEHLNLYGDFYLREIETKIKQSKTQHEAIIKSGFLGAYFAKSMLPKEKLNKMKTFKDKNPLNAQLDKGVIDKFIRQQIQLLNLLDLSKKVSLNKVKIQTSISSLIRLKLGDTFLFFVNHIVRHLQQIDRIEAAMKKV